MPQGAAVDNWIAAAFTIPEIDVIAIAAFVAACGVIVMAVRAVFRLYRRVNTFFDDWYGTDGDDNHDDRPGVLRRMTEIEAGLSKHIIDEERALTTLAEQVDEVKLKLGYELSRNGGGSMKDAAHEALRAVREVQMQQEADVISQREWRKSYEKDRANDERRRLALFAVVRSMIARTPDEQTDMFDRAIAAYTSDLPPEPTD